LSSGKVLEIGVGPGVNFTLYDSARVSKVYALEPNPGMIRLAEPQRQRTKLDIEFLDLPGERIPLQDSSVDTVVSTFTLCTIPGVTQAIRGLRRVLRPSGKLIFFEHGLSPDSRIRHWQERTEPIPHWLFEGCHITHNIPSLLIQGGFQIEEIEAGYLAKFPKSWTYCFGEPPLRNANPQRIESSARQTERSAPEGPESHIESSPEVAPMKRLPPRLESCIA
jgi:SAM-dependent methyltransferase